MEKWSLLYCCLNDTGDESSVVKRGGFVLEAKHEVLSAIVIVPGLLSVKFWNMCPTLLYLKFEFSFLWHKNWKTSDKKGLFTSNVFNLCPLNLFIDIKKTDTMGPSDILAIIHTFTIGATLNSNGGNNGSRQNVTYKQNLKVLDRQNILF